MVTGGAAKGVILVSKTLLLSRSLVCRSELIEEDSISFTLDVNDEVLHRTF